ncbi:hypothetical protein [Streptomyces wuyuanensis]|uniref:Uncharacterized protein n=1 Tax=Streptomyces wuyuanensis TaxID=1196353 RepID=A0A1G9ZCF7_9ACTN|nr:hypothetical protein [Streptomyces wuyuanensis]SDN18601.1 hypothetical protein SAMN05444921_12164 [Streptomyces wuyuanensis]
MAEKDKRTYVKVHDGLPDHPKIIEAGGEAGWLYICGLAYASRQLTDGVLPKRLVPRLTDGSKPEASASALVRVGLWHEGEHDCPTCPEAGADAYVIHDYLEHQRSAAEVADLRAKRSAAGQRGGKRSGESRRAASGAEANREASASAKAKQAGSKTEPETETETEEEQKTSRTPAESEDTPPRHDVERVCKHLASVIEKGGDKRPRITAKWRTDMRRLIDIDGVTPDHAIAAIDWAHADDFWNAHILTPAKLREKYPTLRRQATNQRRQQPAGPQTAPRDMSHMTEQERQRALNF